MTIHDPRSNSSTEAALRAWVGALDAVSEAETIGILRKIGALLIRDCQIHVLDTVIQPLWVEAYYFRADFFPDLNTHRSPLQKNRFGRLYFHRRGYGGLDLCLSDSEDAWLSFLLKASLVNGVFRTQKGALSILSDTGKTKAELEALDHILVPANNRHRVAYAPRVNLAKPCYGDAPLAAFALDALPRYDFRFAHGVLEPTVREYMTGYMAAHPAETGAEYRAACRRVFGWAPAFVGKISNQEP